MNDAPFTAEELQAALTQAGGNISQAAKILGCYRGTVSKYKEKLLVCERYVITNAVNNTAVYAPFWSALKNYCAENDAELLVIPSLYKNPSAMKPSDPVWYPHEIIPHICQVERRLNDQVLVMGDTPIQPTASDPLSGLEPHAQGCWAFFGHPQVSMKVIPAPMDKTPPVIHTTGSVSEKAYSKSKMGKKAELHHTYAAVVVECVGKQAHYRQLIADDSGAFYDLAGGRVRKYTPKGVEETEGAAALITGDEHIFVASERVMNSTYYNADSLTALTHPKAIYRHDVLDFFSRNHHHTDPIQNFVKHLKGADDVRAELQQACSFLEETTPEGSTSYVVASNHNEALDRWIREADPRKDPKNARVLHEISSLIYKIAEETQSAKVNAFEVFARQIAGVGPKVQFLERNKSHEVLEVDVSQHFDKGANGGRGTLATFSKVATRTVGGHSHTPGINKGAVQVGYSGDEFDYQSGLSSWMNTHCLIYRNGKRQLINILGDGSFIA